MADAFDTTKCDLPHVDKLVPTPVISDCEIPSAPDLEYCCAPEVLPAIPGLPGECPLIEAEPESNLENNPEEPPALQAIISPGEFGCSYVFELSGNIPTGTCAIRVGTIADMVDGVVLVTPIDQPEDAEPMDPFEVHDPDNHFCSIKNGFIGYVCFDRGLGFMVFTRVEHQARFVAGTLEGDINTGTEQVDITVDLSSDGKEPPDLEDILGHNPPVGSGYMWEAHAEAAYVAMYDPCEDKYMLIWVAGISFNEEIIFVKYEWEGNELWARAKKVRAINGMFFTWEDSPADDVLILTVEDCPDEESEE